MKKSIKIWLAVFNSFYLLCSYLILLIKVFIDWFGCSCPKSDGSGNLLANQFNVNDFTRIFWISISLIVFIISLIHSLKISAGKKKTLYIIISALISALSGFILIMMTPTAM